MSFTADQVRIAEALYRSEAHCVVACELYGAGRPADAVLHSVRPIADTFPWLETELRSRPEQLRNLMVSVSNLSGALRHAVRPRVARKHLKAVSSSRAAAIDVVAGADSATDAFRVSVGLALLDSASARYAEGVPRGDLNEYQSAYALARSGIDLVAAGGGGDRELDSSLDALGAALPTLDPPARLLRPEDVAGLVDRIAERVARDGAIRPERSALGELDVVEKLLDDVVRSYDEGVPALAARLAASLYVRTYDPLRSVLQTLDLGREERLAENLGVDLRRAINAGAPPEDVGAIADRARELIRSLRQSASSSRDDAPCETIS